MEETSLTKYSASYHALEEKEKVLRGLLAAMDARYERGIFSNGVFLDNIMVMPDYSIRLTGVEGVGGCAAGSDGMAVAEGFYNTDKNPKQTIWSKDLFGLAMSILYLYMGTDICFFSDARQGRDSRPVVDKVMEQMVLAVEERKLPEDIRNMVYLLLLKSSQHIEEKPVFSTMLDRKLPFPATKRWNIPLDNADGVCHCFLEGLYGEEKANLDNGSERLWNSTAFGRTNALNIQHDVAGVLLELEKVEGFEEISHEILNLADAYLSAVDVFHMQKDNSLLSGNHGIAWFLYDFYRQRRDIYPILRDISKIITKAMWGQSNSQCHGNAGSVEFLMDMFDATRDGAFLYQARAIAKYIYTQRFYDLQGHVQFADETKRRACYDYGTGAAGAMRAILRADGYVYDRLYMQFKKM